MFRTTGEHGEICVIVKFPMFRTTEEHGEILDNVKFPMFSASYKKYILTINYLGRKVQADVLIKAMVRICEKTFDSLL